MRYATSLMVWLVQKAEAYPEVRRAFSHVPRARRRGVGRRQELLILGPDILPGEAVGLGQKPHSSHIGIGFRDRDLLGENTWIRPPPLPSASASLSGVVRGQRRFDSAEPSDQPSQLTSPDAEILLRIMKIELRDPERAGMHPGR